MLIFYKKNDQVLELPNLRNGLNETDYKNAATVTATLYDKGGVSVAGCINLTLDYVAASNGTYRGLITEAFDPPVAKNYTLKVDATESGDVFHAEYPVQVVIRTS